ncbi:hypothetical protein [Microbacterium sp. NPDC064584]|uniref:hypothetical protein n=1 Tax=Microbacterium sp. NPDC064584 TaxID=3155817 RepID=UPI00341C8FDE
MVGFAELIGGVPLVLVHLIGLVLLLLLARWGYGKRGIAFALFALVAASVIGLLTAQIFWSGELFELGVSNDVEIVP